MAAAADLGSLLVVIVTYVGGGSLFVGKSMAIRASSKVIFLVTEGYLKVCSETNCIFAPPDMVD